MKLKIKISGPKVHGVGYRPYLIELAMKWSLHGFEVFNDDENGQQVVVVLLEGDDRRINQFVKYATTERPPLALVDKVTSSEYAGDVMPMWQAASINTATQINKAVPILLEIKDNVKEIKGDIKEIRGDVKTVKANTGTIIDEVRGLREDIQPGFATQFQRVQADVRAIKERLGMS
jgi:acylphosphatase